MKKLLGATLVAALLLFLFSIAFHAGRSAGFKTGSEWALLQADIVAREAGMSLPVYLNDGEFRVVFRQPPGLYKKAWQLADRYDRAGRASPTAKPNAEGEKRCVKAEF